jgi:hypothetical protein
MARKLSIEFLNKVVTSFVNQFGDKMNGIYYGLNFNPPGLQSLKTIKSNIITDVKELRKQGFLVVSVNREYNDPLLWPDTYFYGGYNFPVLLVKDNTPDFTQYNPTAPGTIWESCEWMWWIWDGGPYSQTVLHQATVNFRPLIGGINVTNSTKFPLSKGTLGLIAVDNDDDTIVSVSSNHIFNENIFVASNRSPNSVHQNEFNSNVSQRSDGGIATTIGKVKKYVPVVSDLFDNPNFDIFNICDVAASTVNQFDFFNDNLIDSQFDSFEQYNLFFDDLDENHSWAETSEINGLMGFDDDNEVYWTTTCYKSGIGSGPQGLTGDTKIVVGGVSHMSLVYSQNQGQPSPLWMTEGLYMGASADTLPFPNTCHFGAPGDSGSAIYAKFNDGYKVIGLLYGGYIGPYFYNLNMANLAGYYYNPTVILTGFANRIDNIADRLNIRPLDRSFLDNLNQSNFSDTDSTEIIDIPYPFSSDDYIVQDNKKFWQSGIVFFD